MDRSFADRVAVVTGASSGIGWELARQLEASGARVGLLARRQAELETLSEIIRRSSGVAVIAPCDVTDRASVESAVASVRAALGPIDLLIANAGVGMPTLLDPVNIDDVEAMFQVNVLGVIYAFSAVLPEMLARRSGHLAAVSSLAAYLALPGESAYCASKAAVNTYLAGLRPQLRGHGIAVTTLCPGFVQTPMTAGNSFGMPGLLSAERAAQRMLRAIARGQAVCNFPWTTAVLVRLVAALPGWARSRLMASYNEEAARADAAARKAERADARPHCEPHRMTSMGASRDARQAG
jgi:short-subunit dehydrogenase